MCFSQFSRDTLTCSTAADSMTNLADAYTQLGRHDDALQLHDSALRMRRRVLPPNHPSIGALHFAVAFMPLITKISQETLCGILQ
jgi:hypothetical protein